MGKNVFMAAITLSLLLFSATAATLLIDLCSANPFASNITAFTILPDGSLDPKGAPFTRQGDVYTFKGSMRRFSPWPTIYNFHYIVIQRDNIVLDGAGYILEGAKTEGQAGIQLTNCNNVTIKNVEIRDFTFGISAINSSKVVVVENRISGCSVGVKLENCAGSSVLRNSFSDAFLDEVLLVKSDGNLIMQNVLSRNYNPARSSSNFVDIQLRQSMFNKVTQNAITSYSVGVALEHASNNTFFCNNFVANQIQVEANLSLSNPNVWELGGNGNFWSNYNGTDADGDGIGDDAQVIDNDNLDEYPLIEPVSVVEPAFPDPPQRLIDYTNQDPNPSSVEMPNQYINYTITDVNETFWAKVDVARFMHKNLSGGLSVGGISYPIPPDTINISLRLNDAEIPYSQSASTAAKTGWYYPKSSQTLHQTAVGKWSTIAYSIVEVPDNLILEFHYEHPIETINGSYVFLYDFEADYTLATLSLSSPNSTAHFTVRLPADCSDLNVSAVNDAGQFTPQNYTLQSDPSGKTVTFDVLSEFGKPSIAGVAFVFSTENDPLPEFSAWIILPLLMGVSAFLVFYKRSKPK
ncbi:MAG: right-handed parallel beta-helix repeat-containing protein [Candidatus Bathyarchaeota archaeon]|nr:right-handed parallel beta-helix repeat-containing protein [Candidatus Bathyarchaeota archaeon]